MRTILSKTVHHASDCLNAQVLDATCEPRHCTLPALQEKVHPTLSFRTRSVGATVLFPTPLDALPLPGLPPFMDLMTGTVCDQAAAAFL